MYIVVLTFSSAVYHDPGVDPNISAAEMAPTSHERRPSFTSNTYGSHLSYRSPITLSGMQSPVENLHNSYQPSSHSLDYRYNERSHVTLPPSLWMSPASTTPSSPNFPDPHFAPLNHLAIPQHVLPDSVPGTSSSPSTYSTYAESSRSTAPTTASSPQSSRKFSDLFSDDLFASKKSLPTEPTLRDYPSPKLSGSPDLKAAQLADEFDPEQLAKEDPLATQVWKMYAKTKANLPHGHRMENLTWRMMALALKKKKEDEDKVKIEEKTPEATSADNSEKASSSSPTVQKEESVEPAADDGERGRTKGKTRVKVVGFDGANQDGVEDTE